MTRVLSDLQGQPRQKVNITMEYEYSSTGGDEVAELKKIQSDVRTINEALTASIGRLLRREGDMETLERTAEKLSEKAHEFKVVTRKIKGRGILSTRKLVFIIGSIFVSVVILLLVSFLFLVPLNSQ